MLRLLITFLLTHATLPSLIAEEVVRVNGSAQIPENVASRIEHSRTTNNRNGAIDHHLEKLSITIPEGDYLLIASQPMGITGTLVIIYLDEHIARAYPGTHEADQVITEEHIPAHDIEFLKTFLSSNQMQSFPSESGIMGMGGGSTVAYFRIASKERHLSHWGGDHLGMHFFESLLNRYTRPRRSLVRERKRQQLDDK